MSVSHHNPTPADYYQTEKPSTAEVMDTIRAHALSLSDAIKMAKERGITVSIEKAPEGSENLIQIIYSV